MSHTPRAYTCSSLTPHGVQYQHPHQCLQKVFFSSNVFFLARSFFFVFFGAGLCVFFARGFVCLLAFGFVFFFFFTLVFVLLFSQGFFLQGAELFLQRVLFDFFASFFFFFQVFFSNRFFFFYALFFFWRARLFFQRGLLRFFKGVRFFSKGFNFSKEFFCFQRVLVFSMKFFFFYFFHWGLGSFFFEKGLVFLIEEASIFSKGVMFFTMC